MSWSCANAVSKGVEVEVSRTLKRRRFNEGVAGVLCSDIQLYLKCATIRQVEVEWVFPLSGSEGNASAENS